MNKEHIKTIDEMAADVREGKDLHYGGYREVAQSLQSKLSSIKAERDNAEENYLQAYTERYASYEENRKLAKERDLYKEQSETYLKAWKGSTAILEGKNLEIVQLKDLARKEQNKWGQQVIEFLQLHGWKPDAVYSNGKWEPGWSHNEGKEYTNEEMYCHIIENQYKKEEQK